MHVKLSNTERALSFSPLLAAELGLANCLTLTALQEANDYANSQWVCLNTAKLKARLIFLNEPEISQSLQNLQKKGFIHIQGTIHTSKLPVNLTFCLANGDNTPTDKAAKSAEEKDWYPSADTVFRLTMNGISESYTLAQLDGFLLKKAANPNFKQNADSQFFNYVKKRHAYQGSTNPPQENAKHPAFAKISSNNKVKINRHWQPKPLALEILQDNNQVSTQFIEDAIPEFILYWQDRGDASSTWDTLFVNHVRRQWDLVQSNEANARSPKPINNDWQPSHACYECLELAYISQEFAQTLVPEFVLYWRNDGKAFTSWDNKFLQYAKQRWQYLNAATQGQYNGQQSSQSGYATAETSLERLKDTSWAY